MSAQTAGEEIKQLGRESEREGEGETERTLLEIHKFSESFFFFPHIAQGKYVKPSQDSHLQTLSL